MIKLTDTLYISADTNCYILGTPYYDKKGNRIMQNPSYFGTIGMAVNAAIERIVRWKVADGSIETIRDFVTEYERICNELRKTIEGKRHQKQIWL